MKTLSFLLSSLVLPLMQPQAGAADLSVNTLPAPSTVCIAAPAKDPVSARFIRQYTEVLLETTPSDTAAARRALASQLPDGSWKDVDYRSQDRTRWAPRFHLERLTEIARCYADPASPLYRDKAAEDAVGRGLEAWHRVHPRSINWWWNQIYTPRHIGDILLLLTDAGGKIPGKVFADTVRRWVKEGGAPRRHWTGSNLMNIAAHWFIRGVLTGDRALMAFASREVLRPLTMTTGEGLQPDWSYHQHGHQLYIANYGQEWLTLYAFWLNSVRGTPYATQQGADLLSGFALKAFFPSVRGHYLVYNARGRQQANGHLNEDIDTGRCLPVLKQLGRIDPAHAPDFEAIAQRMTGDPKRAVYPPMSTYFYRSDYLLHVRPLFTYDFRTASTRTERTEWGNFENILGHWMAEGASGFHRTGDEYINLSALWDWHKVPGTTLIDMKDDAAVPRFGPGGIPGTETFVGGLSADGCSLAAYVRREARCPAKLARFAFGDTVIALGADLRSEEQRFPLVSTVNQCRRSGKIVPASALEKGLLKTPATLTHGGFRYTFPEKGEVRIASEKRSGPWSRVCKAAKESETAEIFTLWFDHGPAPKGASYTYMVTPEEIPAPAAVRINTADIQGVYDPQTGATGIVFHRAGASAALGGHTYSASAPCVLLRTASGIRTADPEHILDEVTVTVDGRPFRTALPRGPEAGSPRLLNDAEAVTSK